MGSKHGTDALLVSIKVQPSFITVRSSLRVLNSLIIVLGCCQLNIGVSLLVRLLMLVVRMLLMTVADVQAYVNLLVGKVGATAQITEHPLKTVFFGGGTPSLITPRQLDRYGHR